VTFPGSRVCLMEVLEGSMVIFGKLLVDVLRSMQGGCSISKPASCALADESDVVEVCGCNRTGLRGMLEVED
jgi:hypothetical protein